MMKKIFLFLFLFSFELCSAQQWFPLEGGLSGNNSTYNKVASMCVDTINNVLYVGGYFNQCHADTGIIPVLNIARWDGANWSQIIFNYDSVITYIGFGEIITSMIFNGTEIYFTISNDVTSAYRVVKFDVNTLYFSTIGYFNNSLNSLSFYNDSLYIGGAFTQWKSFFSSSWQTGSGVLKWMGSGNQWQQVGGGIAVGGFSEVNSLCVHQNKLYAAGIFETAGGTYCKNIACWNDTSWSVVGSGIGFSGDFGVILMALETYHDKLYVGGDFYASSSGFATGLAIWDNTNWSAAQISPVAVYDLKSIDNKLYLAANWAGVGTAGPWGFISVYNDTTWSLPYKGPRNEVYAIEKFDSDIYAGGKFIGLNDTTICGYVASYDATIIQDTTAIVEVKQNISEIKIYPNPVSEQLTVISEQLINAIEIKDVLGRIIYLAQTNSQLSIINCQLFPSGIYFLKAQLQDGSVVIKKFVKE